MLQKQVGLAGEYFRAGVGAVILNDADQVLVLERSDSPGSWQLPQGGLKPGEDPLQAALREIEEETGIAEDRLRLLAKLPEPLVYVLPAEMRTAKTGMGQVQWWFIFRYKEGGNEALCLPKGEFQAWAWRSIDEVVARAIAFRRPVYEKVRRYLKASKLK
jgi:putative (di)nucleoside polyphosphate hydrolase